MKNIENKMIAIDKEKENIFFFEFIPSISKAFVEFSTDEDLFEQLQRVLMRISTMYKQKL